MINDKLSFLIVFVQSIIIGDQMKEVKEPLEEQIYNRCVIKRKKKLIQFVNGIKIMQHLDR